MSIIIFFRIIFDLIDLISTAYQPLEVIETQKMFLECENFLFSVANKRFLIKVLINELIAGGSD